MSMYVSVCLGDFRNLAEYFGVCCEAGSCCKCELFDGNRLLYSQTDKRTNSHLPFSLLTAVKDTTVDHQQSVNHCCLLLLTMQGFA